MLKSAPRSYVILGIFIAIVAITGGVFALTKHNPASRAPRTHSITITEKGFVPDVLTIQRGDTIVFENEGSSDVWPASDPHPTHEILNAFDPKTAIPPGGDWRLIFEESGSFRFHDHLHVTSHAEIHVLGGQGKLPESECGGPCFDELIRETVEKEGIEAAYALFQETYDQGALPRSCHWTAHQIGEASYELFREGKEFPITHAMSYCGYGFFHGFLEGLLRENPDPEYALGFCSKVEEKLGTMGLWNCYHGIGHGYTEDPPPPESVGDFNEMLKPGIRMCEFLFGDSFSNLNLCLTGVYTVPAGFAADNKYGLALDPEDVFAYCDDQPYRYLKACYGEFAPKLDTILQWDVRKLPAVVEAIRDEKLKRLVTWVVPSVMMSHDIQSHDYSKYVDGCRIGFDPGLREICWGGTILGFFTHGEPDRQYEKVFELCESASWKSEDERSFCWGEGFRQIRSNFAMDTVTDICRRVPEEYQELCTDEKREHKSPYDDPTFD